MLKSHSRIIFIYLLVQFCNAVGFCQNTPIVSTCNIYKAIEITDSIFGPTVIDHPNWNNYMATTSSIIGAHHPYYENGNKQTSGSPGYTGWYKLCVKNSGILTFDLIPSNDTNSYNFSIYKMNEKFYDIANWFKHPIRQSFLFHYKNPVRGLNNTSVTENVNYIGSDNLKYTYLKGISVKEGEVYYIMVKVGTKYTRNVSPFTFHFHIALTNFPIILKNVTFETNKTVLQKTSFAELDKLVKQMQQNPAMQIEISGHTDNVGNELDNKKLSEGRAKAVYDYLISKGITKTRLNFKGYGSTKPIANNTTDEGKQQNRRVEFVVVSK